MASPPLVAWMNPLPIELAPALAARRASVARRTHGRVLDLGGWGDHLGAYPIGDGVESVTMLDRLGDVRSGTGRNDPDGVERIDAAVDDVAELELGPFDSIVSLIRTPLVADLGRFLDTLTGLLADEGHLFFLEPVRRDGRVGRALAIGGRVNRAAGGLHLDRDLPMDVRNRGLVVIDLDRFDVPTLSAPLRPFIEAVVRRPVDPDSERPV